MLVPLSSYFFGAQLTCEKKIERLQITFAVLTPSWSDIIIFQFISDIYIYIYIFLCGL